MPRRKISGAVRKLQHYCSFARDELIERRARWWWGLIASLPQAGEDETFVASCCRLLRFDALAVSRRQLPPQRAPAAAPGIPNARGRAAVDFVRSWECSGSTSEGRSPAPAAKALRHPMRQRKRCPPPAPSKSPPTHCRPRPFENEPSALAPLPAASSPRPSRGLRPRASPLHPLVPETRPFPRSVQVVDENKAPAQVRRRAPSHLFCVGQDRASPPRVARCAATHSRALSAPPPLFSFRPSALPPLPPFAASSPCAARRPPAQPREARRQRRRRRRGSGVLRVARGPPALSPVLPSFLPSFLLSFFPSGASSRTWRRPPRRTPRPRATSPCSTPSSERASSR